MPDEEQGPLPFSLLPESASKMAGDLGVSGDLDVQGNANASSFSGDGSLINFGTVYMSEQSADPDDPVEGMSVMWQSDGTGSGGDGDIMMKITAGGSTKTATVIDFSAV
jgi:hypothetical protein